MLFEGLYLSLYLFSTDFPPRIPIPSVLPFEFAARKFDGFLLLLLFFPSCTISVLKLKSFWFLGKSPRTVSTAVELDVC